jgi:hypothetical protein
VIFVSGFVVLIFAFLVGATFHKSTRAMSAAGALVIVGLCLMVLSVLMLAWTRLP